MVANLNPVTLTRRLREMEQEGLVQRAIVSTTPINIVYQLTDKGRALLPAFDALLSWSNRWLDEEIDDEV